MQVAGIGIAAQEPEQLVQDGAQMQLLGGDQRETRCQVEAHLVAEHADMAMQKTSYFIWLKLPEPWTTCDFARVAEENDILLSTDDIFVVGRRPLPHALRLGLSGAQTIA